MKVISSRNTYEVFDDSLKVYDQLPPQTYVVRFDMRRGFFMEKYVDISVNEEKVYGCHQEKVDKVLQTFRVFDRNLGVILSGDKGIGKSLFARMLSVESIKNGLPVIVVNEYVNGIASYLESIEQEVVVLFDEFDKTFGDIDAPEGAIDPQAAMLSLFDGISGGKKLFVITCNEVRTLSEYLVNRPGRFHYHFRFDYPSSDEIRAYLSDKLSEDRHGEIDAVVNFSGRVNLNYDCLRAIAFELNTGSSFANAIQDLNIIRFGEDIMNYTIRLHYSNGMTAFRRHVDLDMFNDDDDIQWEWLTAKNIDGHFVRVQFSKEDAVYDYSRMCYVVQPCDIDIVYSRDEDYKDVVNAAKSATIEYLTITREETAKIHFAV